MSRRSWTQDDDDLLIALNQQISPRLSRAAIGARFDITGQAAANRYDKLMQLRLLPSRSSGNLRRWTAAENAELLRRCDAGEPFETLAGDLGRSADACKQRYNILKRPVTVIAVGRADPAVTAAEAARLRRDPPVHQSITAWFCGDPLPGRSALDQMREGGQITRDRFAPTLATEPLQ